MLGYGDDYKLILAASRHKDSEIPLAMQVPEMRTAGEKRPAKKTTYLEIKPLRPYGSPTKMKLNRERSSYSQEEVGIDGCAKTIFL